MAELEFIEDLKKLEKLAEDKLLQQVHISMMIAKWQSYFDKYENGLQQELFAND